MFVLYFFTEKYQKLLCNRDQALAVRQSISLGLLLGSSAPDYFIRIRPGIRTVIDKDPVDTVHISSIRQFIQKLHRGRKEAAQSLIELSVI